jgi:predicted  nucleic acid-binding Zn-ribbon protein
MDKHLVGLERAQEEFHQAFNNQLEDVEDEIQVCKMDMDIFRIQMLSMEKDIKDIEMSINNTHLQLEKIKDHVDEFVSSLWSYSNWEVTNNRLLGLEIQRVQKESCVDHESLFGKFAANIPSLIGGLSGLIRSWRG